MVVVAVLPLSVSKIDSSIGWEVLSRKKASSAPDSDKNKLCLDLIKSLALLNWRTAGETKPEIIASEINKKNTTEMSIAAPDCLFICANFRSSLIIFVFNNCPGGLWYRKNQRFGRPGR